LIPQILILLKLVYYGNGWRWCRIKPEFIAAHQSTEFAYIQSIPEFKAWYDFIQDSNDQFREMLGINNKKDLPNNFYPNVRKTILEKTLDNPLNVSEITNSWLDSLTVREEDTFLGQLDANGDPIRTVPVMFINKLADSEKSYNYGHATLLFAKMAYNHKHASELEVFGQAYKALLAENSKQIETDSEGNPIYDYASDIVSKNAKNIEQLFDKFLNFYVYGITTSDDLNKTIEVAGRKINATKAIKKLMNYDRMRALGLKFTTATSAFIASRTALNALKKKNGAVTEELLNKSAKDRLVNRKKWLAITSVLDATNEDLVNRISSKHFLKGLRKYLDERTLFAPFRIGDQFHKDDVAYAMAFNYGLDSDGQIRRLVNLPEGTQSIGESLVLDETGETITFKIGNLSDEQSLEIMESFRTITNRVLYRVTGTIDSSDTYSAQTSLLWQWLLMYKTWMPGIIGERFGKINYDEITDTLEMPRYKAVSHWIAGTKGHRGLKKIASQILKGTVDVATFGVSKKLLYKDGNRVNSELAQIAYREWAFSNPEQADKVSFDEWKKAQEGQISATMHELRVIAGIATLLLLMGTDDDDELYSYKNNYIARMNNKILHRALNEITYFYSPSSVTDLFSRAPLISLITDVTKMFTNTFDETSDIVTGQNLDGEDLQDKTPPGYYTTKLIVGFSGLRSVADMIYEQDKALRK